MTTITLRNTKGTPLTNTELDANFTNLNTDKAEKTDVHYIGTTSIALNRASAVQTLSGTSIDGNAGTVTNGVYTTNSVLMDKGAVTEANLDTATVTGIYVVNYTGFSKNMLVWNTGGSTGTTQLEVMYGGTGAIRLRNRTDNTTWTSWRDILHSNNFNSYALPLSGGTLTGNVQFSANLLQFNNSGVRSWNTGVSGGNLNTYSGDGLGAVTFNGNVALHAGNYNSYSPTLTGGSASGTWSINVTGNAATLSNFIVSNSLNNGQAVASNYIGYINDYSGTALTASVGDGALYKQYYNGSWEHEIYGDYRTGQIALRGKNSGTYQAWRTVLDSANYSSYSPTLTGTGASGTWGINITGNAGTADNATTAGNALLLNNKASSAFHQRVHYGTTAQNTGYYKINILSTVGWMLSFTIRLYQGYQSQDIRVSGYQYGVNYWYNPTASLMDSTDTSIDVRFGYNSVNNLWVAVPAGSYTGLDILDIVNGYTQFDGNYADQFSIVNQTTLTGTVQTTITAYRPVKYNEVLRTDNYNSYSPTLTGTGASGTWGINVTGNAATATSLSGFGNPTTSSTANTIVYRESNGYITNNYFHTTGGGSERLTSGMGYFAGFNSSDYYIRSYTPAAVAIALSGQTMNIVGTATSVPLVSVDNSIAYGRSGLQYVNVSGLAGDVANTTNTPNAEWWHIIRGNHGNATGYYTDLALPMTAANNIRYRRIAVGASSGWITVLDSTNYNSYSPTLTGTGASGTWGINITGNAGTAGTATNLISAAGIIQSASSGTSYSAAIQVREATGGGSSTNMIYAPRLGFHWGGTVASSIAIEASGRIGIFNNPGGAYEAFVCGTLTATNFSGTSSGTNTGDNPGVTAVAGVTPIVSSGGTTPSISHALSGATDGTYNNVTVNTFGHVTAGSNVAYYHSGNVPPYPAEADTLATVTARGATTSSNITFSNGRKGLIGQYDASQTQAIFAMGAAYTLTDGGASNTYGNLYGLAWSYNPDYGGTGNNPQSKAGLNHQLLVMQNGITTTALGSGIWTNGVVVGSGFQGAGTGLTGTASSLSIGGNAATVTNGLTTTNYNSYSPTLTGTGASGTWGINVTGTAASISGFNNPTTAAAGNTIVYRDANGDDYRRYGFAAYFNMSHGASGATTDTVFYSSTDDYIRKNNATGFRASLNVPTRTGGDASGTWSINVTGNAATVTNGLTTSNYNSYSPTLTGTGASGNWGINITGNANTANSATNSSTLNHSFGRTDVAAYPVVWGTTGATSQLYSCTAVNIQSSTGTLNVTTLYATANVTAYSDEKVKTNWRLLNSNFVNELAKVKSGIYDRTDCELTQVGVSAQSLQKILPNAVLEDVEGNLSVAYGHAAMVSAVELSKEVVDLNARIARLEALVSKLIEG